jgi:hypothetical protein
MPCKKRETYALHYVFISWTCHIPNFNCQNSHNSYQSIWKCHTKFDNGGENTLQWPKNVDRNIVFQTYATFNFHQANIKRGFHKWYSK